MNVLIATQGADVHALVVQLALESIDCKVRCFFSADQPTKNLKNTIYIDNKNYSWLSRDNYDEYCENEYDIVWWRRARMPQIPLGLVHPEDHMFAKIENELFFESLTYNLAPKAWWINKKEAARRANAKLLQLRIAQECGLQIPATLVSNDADKIRDFCIEHKKLGVVYKPLSPHIWSEADNVRMIYTTKIDPESLPCDKTLKNTPGIFQSEVLKAYELRIMCFGTYIYAVKLDSQIHQEGKVDWRIIRDGRLNVTPYTLPKSLENNIKLLMSKLDLSFGCLDFIVTKEGEYIFLEVNEQGQFLWIEEHNPEIKMLDMFVNFLISGLPNNPYFWDPKTAIHSIAMYEQDLRKALAKNRERHLALNQL